MNAEFNWWLLIVGVVVGAVLTYLVLADSARRERDVAEREVPAEAAWLARSLTDEGRPVDGDTAEALLRAHRRYLGLPPPDALVDPDTLEPIDAGSDHVAPPPESLAVRPPDAGPAAVAPTAEAPPFRTEAGAPRPEPRSVDPAGRGSVRP
jgi:hypothetical protein